MDLKKLTPGEMVTAVSGVLLLIFSFFTWYGFDLGPFGDISQNAWQRPGAFWSIIAVLLGVILAAHVIVEKVGGMDLPERLGSVGWGVMHLAGGAIAFIFVIIKAISNDGLDRKIGLWVGLLCSLGLLVGVGDPVEIGPESGALHHLHGDPAVLGDGHGSTGPIDQ